MDGTLSFLCDARRQRPALAHHWALLWLLASIGCAAPVTRAPLDPGYNRESVFKNEISLQYLGTHYASEQPTPVERETLDLATALKNQGVTSTLSPSLSHAAQFLAQAHQRGGALDGDLRSLALAVAGHTRPLARVRKFWSKRASKHKIINYYRPQLRQLLLEYPDKHYGVGIASNWSGSTLILIIQSDDISFAPFPRQLETQERLAFELKRSFTEPTLYVTTPDGSVDKSLARGSRDSGSFEVFCKGSGRHDIEVMARNETGPHVIANFPVWCGQSSPPKTFTLRYKPAAQATDLAQGERTLLDLINESRAQHQLPPLKWDDKAAAVARAHSMDMRDNDYFAHISPTTGSVGDRAQKASLRYSLIIENLGSGSDCQSIHHGLMGSPGHRSAILSPDVNRVGIGLVSKRIVRRPHPSLKREQLWATQIFLNDPPNLKPDNIRALITKAFEQRAKRLKNKRGVPKSNRQFQKIAQELAAFTAAGRKLTDAFVKQKWGKLRGYSQWSMVSFETNQLDFSTKVEKLPGHGWHYGVGVSHRGKGPSRRAIVVIGFGRPR